MAAQALFLARDEYSIEVWPGPLSDLPNHLATVQWAFDRLTPMHILASKIGWTFNDLLKSISAIGIESTRYLLQQSHVDQLRDDATDAHQFRDDAMDARRIRAASKVNGSLGGFHKHQAKVEALKDARRFLRIYRSSPELQDDYRTPATFLKERMKISLKTADRYLRELAAERQ